MGFGLGFAISVIGQFLYVTSEIPLNHAGPAAFIKSISRGFPSVTAMPVQDKRAVLVHGPRFAVKEVVDAAPLFDVQPRPVHLGIRFANLAENSSFSAEVKTANNGTARIGSEADGFECSFTPRINGDGTITVVATLTLIGEKPSVVVRLNQSQTAIIRIERIGAVQAIRVLTDLAECEKLPTPQAELRLTASVL